MLATRAPVAPNFLDTVTNAPRAAIDAPVARSSEGNEGILDQLQTSIAGALGGGDPSGSDYDQADDIINLMTGGYRNASRGKGLAADAWNALPDEAQTKKFASELPHSKDPVIHPLADSLLNPLAWPHLAANIGAAARYDLMPYVRKTAAKYSDKEQYPNGMLPSDMDIEDIGMIATSAPVGGAIAGAIGGVPKGAIAANAIKRSSGKAGLEARLKKVAPEAKSSVSETGNNISIGKLVVPKDARNSGVGTKFMDEMVKYADENGKTITLTADGDFGGSKAGQIRFYKRHGFTLNKGRDKDFSISENMVRRPKLTDEPGAVLPMDQASRMARAKEMGFDTDTPWYHGRNNEGSPFTGDAFTPSGGGNLGAGVYMTKDPRRASGYAEKVHNDPSMPFLHGGEVHPLRARGNMARADEYDDALQMAKEQGFKAWDKPKRAQEILKDQGFTGISEGGNAVIFDPSNIRSPNAAFDPKKSKSSNILSANQQRSALPAALLAARDKSVEWVKNLDLPRAKAEKAKKAEEAAKKAKHDKWMEEFDVAEAAEVAEDARVSAMSRQDQLNNLFHGTSHSFDGPMRPGVADAVFFAPNKNVANNYAVPSGTASVMPAKAKGNFFDFRNAAHRKIIENDAKLTDSQKRFLERGHWSALENPETQKILKDRGFDGWWGNEAQGAARSDTLGVFNEGTVTSPLTGETLFSNQQKSALPAIATAAKDTADDAAQVAKWKAEFDADQAAMFANDDAVNAMPREQQLQNLYHGTPAGFTGKMKPGEADAVYFTPSKDLANDFAKPAAWNETGAVIPAKAEGNFFDPKNAAHADALSDYAKFSEKERNFLKNKAGWTIFEDPTVQRFLRQRGFDGWWAKEQGVDTLGVFNEGTVKSKLTGETLFANPGEASLPGLLADLAAGNPNDDEIEELAKSIAVVLDSKRN